MAHTAGATQGPWNPRSPCPPPRGSSPRLHPANWHPRLWAAGKGDGLGEAQGSNVQRSAAAQASCVCVRGGQPAADGARTADQTTRLKDMALDRVPRRVGVVGYGRLGESLTVWGSSPGPFLKPPKPCVATNTPFTQVCVCALAGCLSSFYSPPWGLPPSLGLRPPPPGSLSPVL